MAAALDAQERLEREELLLQSANRRVRLSMRNHTMELIPPDEMAREESRYMRWALTQWEPLQDSITGSTSSVLALSQLTVTAPPEEDPGRKHNLNPEGAAGVGNGDELAVLAAHPCLAGELQLTRGAPNETNDDIGSSDDEIFSDDEDEEDAAKHDEKGLEELDEEEIAAREAARIAKREEQARTLSVEKLLMMAGFDSRGAASYEQEREEAEAVAFAEAVARANNRVAGQAEEEEEDLLLTGGPPTKKKKKGKLKRKQMEAMKAGSDGLLGEPLKALAAGGVLVLGGPSSGKSTLLRRLLVHALRSGGDEGQSPHPTGAGCMLSGHKEGMSSTGPGTGCSARNNGSIHKQRLTQRSMVPLLIPVAELVKFMVRLESAASADEERLLDKQQLSCVYGSRYQAQVRTADTGPRGGTAGPLTKRPGTFFAGPRGAGSLGAGLAGALGCRPGTRENLVGGGSRPNTSNTMVSFGGMSEFNFDNDGPVDSGMGRLEQGLAGAANPRPGTQEARKPESIITSSGSALSVLPTIHSPLPLELSPMGAMGGFNQFSKLGLSTRSPVPVEVGLGNTEPPEGMQGMDAANAAIGSFRPVTPHSPGPVRFDELSTEQASAVAEGSVGAGSAVSGSAVESTTTTSTAHGHPSSVGASSIASSQRPPSPPPPKPVYTAPESNLGVELGVPFASHGGGPSGLGVGGTDLLLLYLRERFGPRSARYNYLRQLQLSRRLVLLLDGIDAAPLPYRQRIEAWAATELNHGGRIIIACRHGSFDAGLFRLFSRAHVRPLPMLQLVRHAKAHLSGAARCQFGLELTSRGNKMLALASCPQTLGLVVGAVKGAVGSRYRWCNRFVEHLNLHTKRLVKGADGLETEELVPIVDDGGYGPEETPYITPQSVDPHTHPWAVQEWSESLDTDLADFKGGLFTDGTSVGFHIIFSVMMRRMRQGSPRLARAKVRTGDHW
jgi:hypothetical protein